jgi:hypothetical protein
MINAMEGIERLEEERKNLPEKMGNTAGDFGRGLLAGFLGTVALTIVQMIEMKISKRNASDVPVQAAGKVVGFQPKGQDEEATKNKERLNNMVHFTYGSFLGEARAVISAFGLRGWKATLGHFATVWGTELVMLPSLKVAPPVKDWGGATLVKDGLLHLLYAVTTGIVYDALEEQSC